MANESLDKLRDVMNQLRSPGGCPWDAEQSHESLIKYLIEETYETIDAIESRDRDHLVEELGDLLLQVFFHARIGEERVESPFDINDIAEAIIDKLVRRHPHVFPDASGKLVDAPDAAVVEQNWQALKNTEKNRESVTDGVPVSMPPLTQITKLVTRLINDNQEVPTDKKLTDLVNSLELEPVEAAELILALISQLQTGGTDVEKQMRQAVADFRSRIKAQEAGR